MIILTGHQQRRLNVRFPFLAALLAANAFFAAPAPADNSTATNKSNVQVGVPVEVDLREAVQEFPIFTTGPAWHSDGGGYFPVLSRLNNGDLACAFRTGQQHRGPGGAISLSRSSDQGRTWSTPVLVTKGTGNDEDGVDDYRNPSLVQAANGDLVMAFGILIENSIGKFRVGGTKVTRSSDLGNTWSAPEDIDYIEKGQAMIPRDTRPSPYGQMRRLNDGTLVFNARAAQRDAHGQHNRETYLFWSKDHGKTWSDFTLIRHHRSETGFLPLSDTEWVGFARYGKGKKPPFEGFKFDDRGPLLIWSHDGGRTWPDELEWASNPNRKRSMMRHPGSIVKLSGNRVLITYGYRSEPYGIRAVVSHDGGKTFDLTREYVLGGSFGNPDCGYPSTVVLEDGTIVTACYTIVHRTHPEWGVCAVALVYPESLFEASPQ